MSTVDKVYEQAALHTGKSAEELRGMAEGIFASILFHSLRTSGGVWTCSRIINGRLEIEVNIPPRLPLRRL